MILENEKGERSRLKSVIETEFARVRSIESPGLGTGCHLKDFKKFVYPTVLASYSSSAASALGCGDLLFVFIDKLTLQHKDPSEAGRSFTAARFLECLRNNLQIHRLLISRYTAL